MKADINVTPLVDVLLVLLIIFLLVTPSTPRGLNAGLPRKPDEGAATKGAALVVEVTSDEYRLNDVPSFSIGDLERQLRAAPATNRTVIIRPTGDVAYERVVAAVDAATGAGASPIGLVDDPPEARLGARP